MTNFAFDFLTRLLFLDNIYPIKESEYTYSIYNLYIYMFINFKLYITVLYTAECLVTP